MEHFKSLIKKYFLLLVASYIGIRLLSGILILSIPDFLSYQVSENTYRAFSVNTLILLFEYLISFLFIYNIRKDLKEIGFKSAPILFITFFSAPAGIILCLIILFYFDYKKGKYPYENVA